LLLRTSWSPLLAKGAYPRIRAFGEILNWEAAYKIGKVILGGGHPVGGGEGGFSTKTQYDRGKRKTGVGAAQ